MDTQSYKSHEYVYRYDRKSRVKNWFFGILIGITVILFLPWTQNFRSNGLVTTLYQDQRPQQVNTVIGGQLIKWYVKEGDVVKAGDTLVQLSEVKPDYLDPALLERTAEQLDGKSQSVEFYKQKAGTATLQLEALDKGIGLKLEQLKNKLTQLELKVQADSAETVAAQNDLNIARLQFERQRILLDSGLVSLVQLEQRNQTYQSALAKKISAENKYANTKQELVITRLEIRAQIQENLEKKAKAEGDRLQSLTSIANGQAEIAKLKNLYASYSIRNGMYYILAPQNGQVIKAKKAGIGEYLKEGEMIVEIVPEKIAYAVEMFVRPLDAPLIHPGQKVRLLFDGFPAIVFSGWPNASYGTFGGIVTAVERNTNGEGKFRVLVKEDPSDKPWPPQLQIGAGGQGIALLKDVPVWYELWRNINGFPADYYKPTASISSKKN
ncbi:MAG: HlyD family efflux transporter periplasmic adaptor subunit [Chitinophagaceae bacterium]|nr:HlyD family efflux transporter periplasmic adaptor subunit [Chitinophagaceae bacterium]